MLAYCRITFKHQFPSAHWSSATLNLVSTHMGDRCPLPGFVTYLVGLTIYWCTQSRHVFRRRPRYVDVLLNWLVERTTRSRASVGCGGGIQLLLTRRISLATTNLWVQNCIYVRYERIHIAQFHLLGKMSFTEVNRGKEVVTVNQFFFKCIFLRYLLRG